jgi:hypothetical protein
MDDQAERELTDCDPDAEYGGRFVTPTREGFAIDPGVRERFERLAGPDVFWDAQDRCWRWRHPWER